MWLDRTVYDDSEVASELAKRNVLALKADTTNAAAPASDMLKRRFGGAPPLTVLLAPGGREPIRLEGKFTKTKLFDALREAEGRRVGDKPAAPQRIAATGGDK
jgi:thiol:disulfide interchange protein